MLDKLLKKLEICQHTMKQASDAANLPGGCPICAQRKMMIMEKLIRGYEKMADKVSDFIATVPGLMGTSLTNAVARLAERTNTAEADLKIATSPKAMGARNAAIEAELRKAKDWAENIAEDERVTSWVHGTDYELYKTLVDPPVDFSVLDLKKPAVKP